MLALLSGRAATAGGCLPGETTHTATAVARAVEFVPALPANATCYEQGLRWRAAVLAEFLQHTAAARADARFAPWSHREVAHVLGVQRDYVTTLRELGRGPAGTGDWWAAQFALLDGVALDVLSSCRLDEARKADALRLIDAQRRLLAGWAAEDARRRA